HESQDNVHHHVTYVQSSRWCTMPRTWQTMAASRSHRRSQPGNGARPVYTDVERHFVARREENRSMAGINVVLISTYELGRQPFGLASPAAWLHEAGAAVACLDLAVQRLDEELIAAADLVAFYVPMHTATRIAAPLVARVKTLNPTAHLCFYGLYAPVNE